MNYDPQQAAKTPRPILAFSITGPLLTKGIVAAPVGQHFIIVLTCGRELTAYQIESAPHAQNHDFWLVSLDREATQTADVRKEAVALVMAVISPGSVRENISR